MLLCWHKLEKANFKPTYPWLKIMTGNAPCESSGCEL